MDFEPDFQKSEKTTGQTDNKQPNLARLGSQEYKGEHPG